MSALSHFALSIEHAISFSYITLLKVSKTNREHTFM